MTTEIRLQANTSGFQLFDNYDVATTLKAVYDFTILSPTKTQTSKLEVFTDGLDSYETLTSVVSDNSSPIDISSYIGAFEGCISITTTEDNTSIIATKEVFTTNVYGENVQSGKIIYGEEGFGIDLNSALPTITVRQEDNNSWGDINDFMIANTIGPVTSEDEILNNEWVAINGSQMADDQIISSGQTPNYQYQEVIGEAGYHYTISGSIFYEIVETDDAKENAQRARGQCFLRVGKEPGSSEYLNYNLSTTTENISLSFLSDQDTFYVSIGYGSRSNIVNIDNMSVKKSVPFHTWNKDEGTYYMEWDNIAAGVTVARFCNDANTTIFNVIINGTYDQIRINVAERYNDTGVSSTANVGIQHSTLNKLAFTKNAAVLNNNAPVALQFDPTELLNVVFVVDPDLFSYIPTTYSNTQLIEMTG